MAYAALEEKYGLSSRAMEVYDHAVRTVPQAERLPIYEQYLARAEKDFGISKTREIYEDAIEAQPPHELADPDCLKLALGYASLEIVLLSWMFFQSCQTLPTCYPHVEKLEKGTNSASLTEKFSLKRPSPPLQRLWAEKTV